MVRLGTWEIPTVHHSGISSLDNALPRTREGTDCGDGKRKVILPQVDIFPNWTNVQIEGSAFYPVSLVSYDMMDTFLNSNFPEGRNLTTIVYPNRGLPGDCGAPACYRKYTRDSGWINHFSTQEALSAKQTATARAIADGTPGTPTPTALPTLTPPPTPVPTVLTRKGIPRGVILLCGLPLDCALQSDIVDHEYGHLVHDKMGGFGGEYNLELSFQEGIADSLRIAKDGATFALNRENRNLLRPRASDINNGTPVPIPTPGGNYDAYLNALTRIQGGWLFDISDGVQQPTANTSCPCASDQSKDLVRYSLSKVWQSFNQPYEGSPLNQPKAWAGEFISRNSISGSKLCDIGNLTFFHNIVNPTECPILPSTPTPGP